MNPKKRSDWLFIDRKEMSRSRLVVSAMCIGFAIAGFCDESIYGTLAGTMFLFSTAVQF